MGPWYSGEVGVCAQFVTSNIFFKQDFFLNSCGSKGIRYMMRKYLFHPIPHKDYSLSPYI